MTNTDDNGRRLARTVLTPRLDGFGLLDFGRLDELVDRGREATRDALPQLRGLLRSAERSGPPGISGL